MAIIHWCNCHFQIIKHLYRWQIIAFKSYSLPFSFSFLFLMLIRKGVFELLLYNKNTQTCCGVQIIIILLHIREHCASNIKH